MNAQTQDTKQYACIEFVKFEGLDLCKTWQVLETSSSPNLPFTKEEADQITIAVCSVLVLVWGLRLIKKQIR